MSDKKQILILCTGNSCRSQMAEGLARQLFSDRIDVFSAGTKPSFVHPMAIEVMQEVGIDISAHRSKHVDEFKHANIDLVITVCDHANESCPVFLGSKRRAHWPFEDPAHAKGSESEVKDMFRAVRDDIKISFQKLLPHWL